MNWKNEALKYLVRYASMHKQHGRTFLAEDFISAYSNTNKPMPHDKREFGSLFYSARKAGLITKVGYKPARTSNNNHKTLWSAS